MKIKENVTHYQEKRKQGPVVRRLMYKLADKNLKTMLKAVMNGKIGVPRRHIETIKKKKGLNRNSRTETYNI